MALIDKKISNSERDSIRVKSAATRPRGTAQQIKDIFDKLPELITSKHNGLIDEIILSEDGKEDVSNKVSEWSETVTDDNYPSEKLVKDTLDEKYEKPSGGIPSTDMTSAVQTSLGKADSALQEHQSLSAYRTSAAQDLIDATKLSDAPSDDKQYARKNGAWSEVEEGSEAVWGQITGTLSDQTDLDTALDGKADTSHTHTKSDVTDFSHTHTKSEVTDFSHTHTKSEVTDFSHTHTKSEVTDFAHTHDDRYYTEAEIDTALSTKADASDIPTKTSDLTNDSGFLTEHQSLSAYRTASAQDAIDNGFVKQSSTLSQTIDANSAVPLHIKNKIVGQHKAYLAFETYVDAGIGYLGINSGNPVFLASDGVTEKVLENTSNKVTSVSSSSTDTQYPSAKCLYDSLDDKVDKVTGKQLSTEDYTSAEKTKLSGIEEGADVTDATNVASAGAEMTSNKVTSLSSASTNTQYPSAKCVYDIEDEQDRKIEVLDKIRRGQGYDIDTNNETAYSVNVPSGAFRDNVLMIGGKSVVMNQKINALNYVTKTVNGVTFTNNGDGTITVDGTATAKIIEYLATGNYTSGNKIYGTGGVDGATSTYYTNFNYGGVNCTSKNGCIFTSGIYLHTRIVIQSGITLSNVVFTPQFIDLTQMFGSGNEPTTVAEFKAMFPADYYAYSTGEVKSAIVNEVVASGDNPTTISIPSAIQALDGYGWGAGSVYNYVDYAEKKFHKRVGRVDLGSLSWVYTLRNGKSFFGAMPPSDSASVVSGNGINAICPIYSKAGASAVWGATSEKIMCVNGNVWTGGKAIGVVDSTYSDAASFKTAMSGKYLYYELATEVVTDISSLVDADFLEHIPVETGGTVTFKNTNGSDYQLPVPVTNEYIVDLNEVI